MYVLFKPSSAQSTLKYILSVSVISLWFTLRT